jgi:RND family efflux transporter MFP subunit
MVVLGCNQKSREDKNGAGKKEEADKGSAVAVEVERPTRGRIRLKVRQPGTIQAYERTAIFAKVPGYVLTWHVDIGDHVKKGKELVELWVPEMVVDLERKKSLVKQAEAEVKLARAAVDVAESEHRRLKGQAERLAKLANGLLDQENLAEARSGAESSRAKVEQAREEVAVKEANVKVARENLDYTATLLKYTRLTAPYDGVVTRKYVNTGDFVQPATGGSRGDPLYVIERRDRMRVFVDVPEEAADWVSKGAEARVYVPALGGRALTDRVKRTSYALDRTAHTLTAEIDLENPDDRLRPGMYAYGTITAESRESLRSVSASAILTEVDVLQGDRHYCFLVEEGKAGRVPVQIGARGDERVQLLKKQVKPAGGGKPVWEDFTGEEMVIRGKLAGLSDGQAVKVAPDKK